MREKTIPYICAPIAYVTLFVSTALTLMFMVKLAGDDNLLKGIFVAVGIIIEVIKAILPIVIFYTFARRQWAFACMLGAMYLVMAAISFSSSAAALEERINQSLSVSVESATNLDKIEIVKQEVKDKRVLFAEQQSANQVSKMDTTSAEISELNTQLLQLMSNSQSAQDTVLSRYKGLLIYSIAGLIEVISPVMALIIMLSDTKRLPRQQDEFGLMELVHQQGALLSEFMASKKQPNNDLSLTPKQEGANRDDLPKQLHERTPKEAITLAKKAETKEPDQLLSNVYQKEENELKEVVNQLSQSNEQAPVECTTATAEYNVHAELYDEIKTKVCGKFIKPTFRDIAANYKLSRDEITQLLKMMEDEGALCLGKGNRYTVAA